MFFASRILIGSTHHRVITHIRLILPKVKRKCDES